MEIKEVNFKRYIPAEGKALKFVVSRYNFHTNEMERATIYSNCPVTIDINDASDIEEVSIEEYNEYVRNNSVGVGTYLDV